MVSIFSEHDFEFKPSSSYVTLMDVTASSTAVQFPPIRHFPLKVCTLFFVSHEIDPPVHSQIYAIKYLYILMVQIIF